MRTGQLIIINVFYFSDLDLLFSGDGEVDWAEFQVKLPSSRNISFSDHFS